MHSRIGVPSGLLLAATLVFGAFQAAQARSVLRQMDCPESGNWCANSRGGDTNCNQCCGTFDESICIFYDEDSGPPPLSQGCICA
jgi:hypothetical protein